MSIAVDAKVGQMLNSCAIDRTEQLLHPHLLLFLDFQCLMTFSTLNKRFRQLALDENSALGFWPALCNSFCVYKGLYSPVLVNPENIIPRFNYRKHFFDELWVLRHKWTNHGSDNLSYKVRVSCRFRPGEPPAGRVCLPLHQFLRFRRQKRAQIEQNPESENNKENKIFVGEKDPEEFCDPFLGSLMREPVLLASSGKIVDRTVAIQCIHRGGKDPFNGRKLTLQMLQPQPELAARIQAWRERPERNDISIDIKDAKGLADDPAVNHDFLEALLEVERMQNMMKKVNKLEHMRLAGIQYESGEEELPDELPGVDNNDNNDNAINPDITVGLLNEEDMDLAAETNNMFSIHALMQSNAATNPVLSLQQGTESNASSKKTEIARVVEVKENSGFVSMHVPGTGIRQFNFSNVYSPNIAQQAVYEKTAKDSVEAALNGYNACVLCYGQTGSGKTYSFLGPEEMLEKEEINQQKVVMSNTCQENSAAIAASSSVGGPVNSLNVHKESLESVLPQSGMLIRAAAEFFHARSLLATRGQGIAIGVKVQIVEVYEEKVTDLMTGRVVQVRRDTGHIAHGSEHPCDTLQDFLSLYKIAHGRQRFAETAMNERSSRAHTLVIFHIAQQRSVLTTWDETVKDENEKQQEEEEEEEEEIRLIQSQLYLVDLAGSERVKKSKVTGQRMREAVGINSSLLVLGKVISALVEGEAHVPYLESKLTTLLKAAFGGNARTMVLVNTRTEEEHGDETLQSLRFGERCGMISNSLKQTASSFESTMATIDDALTTLQSQLQALQRRGKEHLESYKTLQVSLEALTRKKQELLALNAVKSMRTMANSQESN